MELVTMLAMVVSYPLVCLGFLIWMAYLEDTLPAAVRRTGRRPDPAPILAINVTPEPMVEPAPLAAASGPDEDFTPVHVPAQRHGPLAGLHPHGEAEPAVAPTT